MYEEEQEFRVLNEVIYCPVEHFVKELCGARFRHQKRNLYADTCLLLSTSRYDTWLMDVFSLANQEDLIEWLLKSRNQPSAFLAKFMLIQGFYASSAKDLQEFAMDWLSFLMLSVLPTNKRFTTRVNC
ncbi:hypothetical protein HAQ01_05030 [Acidithiobacillus thiooxidans]|uniref:hypothetical protein n=1 Tax=Acidithiobacillus thiooxidans TaxID=930 RepID=UPI001C0703D1|nr:hypothetical protein [Acidithiobacillus thiooxidans]MBU2792756.1 hypothetical protein [Acidithiobacillus thiooxidans]